MIWRVYEDKSGFYEGGALDSKGAPTLSSHFGDLRRDLVSSVNKCVTEACQGEQRLSSASASCVTCRDSGLTADYMSKLFWIFVSS